MKLFDFQRPAEDAHSADPAVATLAHIHQILPPPQAGEFILSIFDKVPLKGNRAILPHIPDLIDYESLALEELAHASAARTSADRRDHLNRAAVFATLGESQKTLSCNHTTYSSEHLEQALRKT